MAGASDVWNLITFVTKPYYTCDFIKFATKLYYTCDFITFVTSYYTCAFNICTRYGSSVPTTFGRDCLKEIWEEFFSEGNASDRHGVTIF